MKKLIPIFLLFALACSKELQINKEKYRNLYRAGMTLSTAKPTDYFLAGISRRIFADRLGQIEKEHKAVGRGTTRAERAMLDIYGQGCRDLSVGFFWYECWVFDGRRDDQSMRRAIVSLFVGIGRIKVAGNLYSNGKISVAELEFIEQEEAAFIKELRRSLKESGIIKNE